jgi:hypothetical protein
MKYLNRLVAVASAAFFITSAQAQNAGTVTSNAFAVGKGAGQQGFASVLCTQAQIAIGQNAAKPICAALSGDVTMNASGVTAIGASKVTAAMIAPMTSAQWLAILSDETGTGAAVFAGSPALTGTPTAPTAAVDTNTAQLATTAMVLGQAAAATPGAITNTAAVGTSTRYARADHVHAYDNTAWTTYTPTLSCGTGSFTSASASGRYKQIGKTVFVQVTLTVTTNGTCAGSMRVSTPITAGGNSYAMSVFDSLSAATGSAVISSADGTTIRIFTTSGAYPTGFNPVVTGVYEIP